MLGPSISGTKCGRDFLQLSGYIKKWDFGGKVSIYLTSKQNGSYAETAMVVGLSLCIHSSKLPFSSVCVWGGGGAGRVKLLNGACIHSAFSSVQDGLANNRISFMVT